VIDLHASTPLGRVRQVAFQETRRADARIVG
jgi:hypothetical protein